MMPSEPRTNRPDPDAFEPVLPESCGGAQGGRAGPGPTAGAADPLRTRGGESGRGTHTPGSHAQRARKP
jgi:hypothetical protein